MALLDEQLSQLQKTASSGHEAAELPRVDVALVEHAPPEGSAQPVIQHLLRSSLNVPIIGKYSTGCYSSARRLLQT